MQLRRSTEVLQINRLSPRGRRRLRRKGFDIFEHQDYPYFPRYVLLRGPNKHEIAHDYIWPYPY